MHNQYTKILAGIERHFKNAGYRRAVIGVSGGIDSALSLKLVVDALKADYVTAVIMPEKGVTIEENNIHAKALCNFFKVETFFVPINKYLTDFLLLPWQPSELAQINMKARVRMNILYNYSNSNKSMVVGTSNKTELSIGYGTKHGDLAADFHVLGDLYKEEVYALARHLELPEELIQKTPSAELFEGQTDEEELDMKYKEIDAILKNREQGLSPEELIHKGLKPKSVHKTFRLIQENEHKTLPIPIIKAK